MTLPEQKATLDAVIALVEASPHSAAGLTLYALISTLEFERAGYLFKLDKFKDLDAAQRRLAYDLIELMVAGKIGDAVWQTAKSRLDAIIRGG